MAEARADYYSYWVLSNERISDINETRFVCIVLFIFFVIEFYYVDITIGKKFI